MKIVFVDPIHWGYTCETPLNEPMGGTQSGVAYLTAELARIGQDVTVVNGVAEPVVSADVRFVGHGNLTRPFLNQFDVVVVVSIPMGLRLRNAGVSVPMVLWCHQSHDQPALQDLRQPAERSAWNGYALLSRWQAANYANYLGVPREQMHILGNAVSPAILTMAERKPWFLRGEPPTLAYTSTPYRGLDLLLLAFPTIRKLVPDARLQVYSGMGLYRIAADDDPYSVLYDLCRALPGAEYVGPVPQAQLARALAAIDVHAYPCTYEETSCIAVMEAMASGAMIVTTKLGALTETSAGFGYLMDRHGEPLKVAKDYAAFMGKTLNDAMRGPDATTARLAEQRRYAREHYSWTRRAEEWVHWLGRLIRK